MIARNQYCVDRTGDKLCNVSYKILILLLPANMNILLENLHEQVE